MTAATRRPLGVMGGTFDPIHLGHLAVAEQTREALDLDGVLFVVAADPPHKQGATISPAAHRLAMVELAIADNPWFRVSRMELDRPGPSWSVDTLAELAAQADAEGRERPVFILSVEALAGFPSWREPGRILDLARVAVVPRGGTPVPERAWLTERFPGREDRFVLLDGPRMGHAATDIRARVATGRSIRYLLPRAVAAYIGEHQLYQPAPSPQPLARSTT
ncbi:MAG: nicotinate-nucleotide adenylyltransferase [Chloroflexota bacterium]